MNNWFEELKNDGSSHIKNVFDEKSMNLLNKIINQIKNNEKIFLGMNPFVTNKNRRGAYIGGYEPGKQVPLTQNGRLLILLLQKKLENILQKIFQNKKNHTIYFENSMYFECYPGCEEQEIHLDITVNNREDDRLDFWNEAIKGDSGAYIIIIPLTDSTLEMGSTNYYKTKFWDELDNNELEIFNSKNKESRNKYKNNFGYLDEWNGTIRNKLENNKKIFNVKLGDIQIQNTMSLHAGGKNNTNKIRKYILQWIVFSKNKVNILSNDRIIKIK